MQILIYVHRVCVCTRATHTNVILGSLSYYSFINIYNIFVIFLDISVVFLFHFHFKLSEN